MLGLPLRPAFFQARNCCFGTAATIAFGTALRQPALVTALFRSHDVVKLAASAAVVYAWRAVSQYADSSQDGYRRRAGVRQHDGSGQRRRQTETDSGCTNASGDLCDGQPTISTPPRKKIRSLKAFSR